MARFKSLRERSRSKKQLRRLTMEIVNRPSSDMVKLQVPRNIESEIKFESRHMRAKSAGSKLPSVLIPTASGKGADKKRAQTQIERLEEAKEQENLESLAERFLPKVPSQEEEKKSDNEVRNLELSVQQYDSF